jgi:hypothetical protein
VIEKFGIEAESNREISIRVNLENRDIAEPRNDANRNASVFMFSSLRDDQNW